MMAGLTVVRPGGMWTGEHPECAQSADLCGFDSRTRRLIGREGQQ